MTSKSFFISILSILVFSFGTQAQSKNNSGISGYKNAVGLTMDFGSIYVTGAGAGLKHFFSETDAAEINLLFYNNTFSLGAYYEYNGMIQNAEGLKWYIGLGPQLFLANRETDVAARVPIGLDYKIANVPLDFFFDWRPSVMLTHGTTFTAARFGAGIRFAFGE